MSKHQADTPAALAARMLWERVKARDLDGAYRLLSARDRHAVSLAQWIEAAARSRDFELTSRAQGQWLQEGDEQGDTAVVLMRLIVTNPGQPPRPFEFRYRMVREADGWHVDLGLDRVARPPSGDGHPPGS